MADATRTRRTADERRAQVVEAALEEFAQAGLAGASTEAIARRAGISHAYLFRLFGTKRDLFLATVDRAFGHVLDVFREAWSTRDPAWPPLAVLGTSYPPILQDRKELLFQFHAFAACADPEIRARVRERYLDCFRWVCDTTGEPEDSVRMFMSTGLLIAVSEALDEPVLAEKGEYMARMAGWPEHDHET
jgi:AcrR family transcriptional regulator